MDVCGRRAGEKFKNEFLPRHFYKIALWLTEVSSLSCPDLDIPGHRLFSEREELDRFFGLRQADDLIGHDRNAHPGSSHLETRDMAGKFHFYRRADMACFEQLVCRIADAVLWMKKEKRCVFKCPQIYACRTAGNALTVKDISLPGDEDKLFLIERLDLDAGKRFFSVDRKKDEIDASFPECFYQFITAVCHNCHFDSWIAIGKLRKQAGDDVGGPLSRCADAQSSCHVIGDVPENFHQLVIFEKDPAGGFDVMFPGKRQCQWSRGTVKELDAELFFCFLDIVAQRRL